MARRAERQGKVKQERGVAVQRRPGVPSRPLFTLTFRALKTIVLNIYSQARTNKIPCEPDLSIPKAVYTYHGGSGRPVHSGGVGEASEAGGAENRRGPVGNDRAQQKI